MEFVYIEFHSNIPTTYDALLNFFVNRFDITMLLNTLYKLVSRILQLKPALATPIESERVNCNIKDIDNFYDQLEEILSNGIPAPFVIKVDETGCSEWADASQITVLIPSEYPDDNIKIPISRASKRSSMFVGICKDGTTISPGIVIQRKTVELEL